MNTHAAFHVCRSVCWILDRSSLVKIFGPEEVARRDEGAEQ